MHSLVFIDPYYLYYQRNIIDERPNIYIHMFCSGTILLYRINNTIVHPSSINYQIEEQAFRVGHFVTKHNVSICSKPLFNCHESTIYHISWSIYILDCLLLFGNM